MDWLPLVSYVLIATFTPGPNNIMSMSNAVRDGFRRTLPSLLGILCATSLLFSLCGALNLLVGALAPVAIFWLTLAGTLYMLFLAVVIMRSQPHTAEQPAIQINSFIGGFLATFVNLKVIIYGITVYAAFVIGYTRAPGILLLFALGMSLACFISVCLWAAAGHYLRRLFEQHYRPINLVLGGLLAVMAAVNLAELLR